MGAQLESPVTMKALAERLGVSVATVSNAYSRPDQLSAELRQHILATADALGYPGPSAAGRALRSGKSDVCGFLFSGQLSEAFSDPYAVILLSGLSESVGSFGASVLLLQAPEDEDDVQSLQRAPIDAVVVCSAVAHRTSYEVLRRRGVRIVGTQHSAETDWVGIDNVRAGRLIGAHLARLGHRDVVVIAAGAGDGRPEEFTCRADSPGNRLPAESYESGRVRGILQALGLPGLRVVQVPHNSREAGRLAAAHVLDVQDRPTAVVALSDVLALGFAEAARERGLTPGRDLSISGFDDIPDAAFAGLTTVRQPIAEKGRLAGRLAMDPTYPQRRIELPIELVVRASTGPAPRPHPSR
jgi:DNA-binding LacI/PurR family transcriptional regulator